MWFTFLATSLRHHNLTFWSDLAASVRTRGSYREVLPIRIPAAHRALDPFHERLSLFKNKIIRQLVKFVQLSVCVVERYWHGVDLLMLVGENDRVK